MNTTFTNYAEKKAKQFLNLLQGYTKGIRITAILILLLMGIIIPVNAGVFVAGTMNGWNAIANELKSVANDTWRSDIYLEANTTYTFKIVYDEHWCGNSGIITASIANWEFTWDGGNDCTINTKSAGPYTFQWVGNGNKLSVTYPTSKTYTVTVPEGTPDCYICGDMTKWEFRQMTKENNTTYKIAINSTNTAEYKYACAPSWGFQELNSNCNGTIANRTYNANDNVPCWSVKTIYFQPGCWEQDNPRFEVNWWIDGESHSGWVDLVQTECDDYYVAQVPLYKAKVKFCRTNPNDGYQKWNTIDNLTVPADDNNLFTVTDWGSGNWSKLDVVSITTNNPENGTIEVSRAAVNIGETVTVTITPDNNYKIKSYTIGSSTTNVSETGAKSFDLPICSDTEISAVFETTKSKYTVSFDRNGHGNAIAAQEITEGEKVAKPTDPTAEGFTFGGWYTDAECTSEYDFNTTVSSSFTLYAKWIQKYVIVGSGNGTSNSPEMGSWLNGHSWIGDETVLRDNDNIINISKTYIDCPAGIKNFRIVPWGYTWSTGYGYEQLTNCNVPYYGNQDNNIVFVTIAEANITIGFDGTNVTVNVEYDQNDLANVKNSIVSGDKVMFYFGDEWSISDYKYVKDGNVNVVTATKGFLLEGVQGVSANKWLSVAILPSKEYYIHNSANGAETGEAVRAGAIYACYGNNESMGITSGATPTWSNNTISVPLGTAASGLSATCGNSSIGRAQIITDYYYQKEGESTWTKFDPTDVSKLSVGIYKVHALAYDGNIYVRTAEAATLTIYEEYRITYKDQNDADFSGAHEEGYPTSHIYGTATTLKDATKNGYTFGGWHTDAACTQKVTSLGATAYTADITLYAKWTPATYTIQLDNQGGSGLESVAATYNSPLPDVEIPTKTGYTFNGYFEATNGGGFNWYNNNGKCQVNWNKTSGATLYAQWIANDYTVIFDKNAEAVTGTVNNQPFKYGISQPLHKNNYKRNGYFFAGWNTAADGSGTAYSDQISVQNLAASGTITLYAQWTKIEISATLSPNIVSTGTHNLTFTITSNVPVNSQYFVGAYVLRTDHTLNGYIANIVEYDNADQIYSASNQPFNQEGIYYTRAFVQKDGVELATSEELTLTVGNGGTTPDPEDLTWKMYDKTTELGIFTKQDENTYTLTIDVPENCTWTINYKYDQQQYYTGAESLLQERTLVVGNGQVPWQDGAGTFTITIRKEGEVWKISAVKVVGAIDITSCPEYLTTSQSLELGYRFDGIPSTWKYQVCSRNTTTSVDACYNQLTDMPISSPSTFTSTEGLSEGVHEVVIKVYDGEQLMLKSEPKRVTVEAVKQIDIFTIVDGGDPTALGQTISPTEHIGVEVTAAEKAGYIFTGWTSQIQEGQDGTITFSDASTATTTVTATADGRIYANYVNNQPQPTGVYLVGGLLPSWSPTANQEFKKLTIDATVYTYTVTNLKANTTYELRVIYDSKDTHIEYGNNRESLKDNQPCVTLYTGGDNDEQNGNCKITTAKAGDYVFSWNDETHQLCVEYPNNCTVTFFGDGGKVTAVSDDKSLTSPAKVNIGSSVTFTATPNINNQFEKWVDENGNLLSQNATYTVNNIQNDLTVEAVFKKPTPVYLKPSSVWLRDNARFAIYYWQDGKSDGWANMRLVGCNGEYYVADLPIGYTRFKFVRLNPSTKENAFQKDVRWNETGDLTLPADGRNLFDMTHIYLGATDTWDHSKARFAAYFMNFDKQKTKWMSMTYVEGSTRVFRCLIPDEEFYDWVIFGRMNGEISTNDWNNGSVWNKTADLKLTGSGDDSYKMMGNYFTITAMQDPNNNQVSSGEWSWNDIAWSRLELPSITYDTPQNGTMTVKTVSGKTIKTGDKVAWDTDVIITLTPDAGYKVKTANITMGGETQQIVSGQRYNICGNTTIYVEYEIKEEYYLIGLDGDWSNYKEKYLFVDGKAVVELDGPGNKQFKIAKVRGTNLETRYGNVQDFSITKTSATLEIHKNSEHDHCEVKTLHYGEYEFTWNPETMVLDIRFPIMRNDYRLAYQDATTGSFHPERVIKQRTTGERLDTVSFFIDHDNSPKLVLQQCNEVNSANGAVTWTTLNNNITFNVASTGVWNFVLQQTNNGTNTAQVLTGDNIKPYTGDYYIRTASAENGWMYFRQASHKMTYSSYADNNEPFSHYFCKWVSTDAVAANYTKNVKYTIANDYGDCISDTLAADPENANPRIVTNADGDLPTEGANVRFGWDWDTNKIRRAYMAGATNATAATFLRIEQAENLKNSDGAAVTEINFADLQNWIYQVDVKATKTTKIKLTALYANHLQYFKGGAGDGENDKISLLSSEAKDMEFNIRLTYDFKTNHLIIAWLPDNQEAGGKLDANMMIIRKHNRDNVQVTQLHLNSELTDVKTVYGVMTFAKDWIQKSPVTREQSIYWVSFPFDVKVSEIFGFGEYMDAWILQYYDGAERARKGLFADSGTYWKYIMDPNTTLTAGIGYVLVLDLNKVKFNHDVNSVSLYFPSVGKVGTITRDISTTVTVPEHKCEITTGTIDHTITDSHWNLIGVPAFKDVNEFSTDKTLAPVYHQDSVSFYYEFLPNKSTYRANNNVTDFKAMYSYMVQFAGTINWNTKQAIKPAQLAARRNSESELLEKVVLGLELVQGEEKADQTFVQLQQEGATTDFDMNIDLTKIINNGANIYTLTSDRIQAAGNALPMEESVVPVGVQIAAEGEYTFRMPDGTEGMVVELIDYETNTRTNLLLSDYIVTLPKGTSENRFALHIQPQKDVVTSLENIGEGVNNSEAVNKYLIDGKLIIRTAEGVFDAQGHRL